MRTLLGVMAVAVLGCREVAGRPSPTPAATPVPVVSQAATPVPVVNPVAAALAQSGARAVPDDADTCASCHEAVVKEWRDSLHSRSHHGQDPLYAALRTLRIERQGAQVAEGCTGCHTPRAVAGQHESAEARAGVNCATCHQLDAVHLDGGASGRAALQATAELRFRGVHDVADGTSPVHASGPPLPALVDGVTLCLACHGELKNAAGVALCSTGTEHARAEGDGSCTSCHMPEVTGPSGAVSSRPSHRSHAFPGHALLPQAVKLEGALKDGTLTVTVTNTSGHGFPTGFPGRMAFLRLRALDAEGREVYRNIKAEPMKEHPEAVFNAGFVDAQGQPALAAFASRQVRDNRLGPQEVRRLTVKVPATARTAEAQLVYFRVAPPAAKLMGYAGPETAPLAAPVVVVGRP